MKKYLIIAVGLFYFSAVAQDSLKADSPEKLTYVLPDGKVVKEDKLDSLENSWGKGAVMFGHNPDDDENGIIYLIRKTDEMDRMLKESDSNRKTSFTAMLNKPAPHFELKDLKGKTWSLKKLQGKIVVLNFWFTSCAPCIQEMPELNKLTKEFKGDDIVFLALTYNEPEQVNKFLKRFTFNYTVLPNSQEVDKKYGITSWPASIIIDKKGFVRSVMGYSQEIHQDIKKAINSIQ